MVNRAIVRVVTAGTLTEEALLDSRAANWLVAVAKAGERYGIAAADVSTGRFELASIAPAALDAELARLDAAELIAPDALPGVAAEIRKARVRQPAAERRLKERFGVATLDGFGAVRPRRACAPPAGCSPISTRSRASRCPSCGRPRRAAPAII